MTSILHLCFVLFFFLLEGCYLSSGMDIERSSMKVTVKSSGVEVKDFNKELVERRLLSAEQINNILRFYPHRLVLPFEMIKELDSRGGIRGLKISKVLIPSEALSLGLYMNDILTAFGKKLAYSPNDFSAFLVELSSFGQSSITLERSGKPHKIIYNCEDCRK